jgi:hypothetical protein
LHVRGDRCRARQRERAGLSLVAPLGQAPDHASRPFVTLTVTVVPVAKVALPVLPVLTSMPPGDDLTRSPFRPVAVTVSVAV